jgi:hypothetical protein
MTVRQGPLDDNHLYLTGWKLVIALIIVAAVAIITVWITQSVESAVLMVAPLLVVLGVDRYRG